MGILDIGIWELILVLIVAVLIIGPQKLPEYARKMGRIYRNFRRMAGNLTQEFTKAMDMEEEAAELSKTAEEIKKTVDTGVEEIKKTVDTEVEEIKKTVDTEVEEIKETVKAEAKGVKKTLDTEVEGLKKTLDTGAQELAKTSDIEAEELTEVPDTKSTKSPGGQRGRRVGKTRGVRTKVIEKAKAADIQRDDMDIA